MHSSVLSVVAAAAVRITQFGASGVTAVAATTDNARFRKPVVPGDQLKIKVEILKDRGSIFYFHCDAYVDDQIVAEADMLAKCQPKKDNS